MPTMSNQLGLLDHLLAPADLAGRTIADELAAFTYNGKRAEVTLTEAFLEGAKPLHVPTFANEFWTSRQRAANSLHEISYRACFKPQLPRFFIERLTNPGDRVYDPFMGRGTTVLEAALLGRRAVGCDVNPLSAVLVQPRLQPPTTAQVEQRLAKLPLDSEADCRDDLLVFYHPNTLKEIVSLRAYLLEREATGTLDAIDRWIRMVAVNRLTGHSTGFFSVYTLPPNQAVSVEGQRKINAKREQVPTRRDVRRIIATKTASLLSSCDAETRTRLAAYADEAIVLTGRAARTPSLQDRSIDLVVTSPPFLDVVNYAGDNWLRGWFCNIDPSSVGITMAKRLEDWRVAMSEVFQELFRILKPGGHVAFEVGEVRGGKIKLEESVIPAAASAGFSPELVLINSQVFTKTANCWGVTNNSKGTNSNRIVLLRSPR